MRKNRESQWKKLVFDYWEYIRLKGTNTKTNVNKIYSNFLIVTVIPHTKLNME